MLYFFSLRYNAIGFTSQISNYYSNVHMLSGAIKHLNSWCK